MPHGILGPSDRHPTETILDLPLGGHIARDEDLLIPFFWHHDENLVEHPARILGSNAPLWLTTLFATGNPLLASIVSWSLAGGPALLRQLRINNGTSASQLPGLLPLLQHVDA